MKSRIILVSESDIGIHSKAGEKRIDTHVIPMSFFPNIKHEGGKNIISVDSEKAKEVVDFYHTYKKKGYSVTIFVGFDIDLSGEIMSSSLRDFLILHKISKEDIIRTPLTQYGYLAFRDFINIDNYIEYLALQQDFLSFQKKHGLKKPVGFQKAIALNILQKYKNKKSKLSTNISSSNGTSTVTVVSKFLSEVGQ